MTAPNRNPILMVKHAGRGTTRIPDDAKFALGDTVEINTEDGWLSGKVTAIVPRGVSPEIAFADHTEQDRPIMVTRNPRRATSYIVTVDPTKPSYWISKARNIRTTPAAEIEG